MFALHKYLTKKVFFSLANKKKSHAAMVHVLSPNKSSKQIWATKSGKKTCIVKMNMSECQEGNILHNSSFCA